MLRDLGGDNGTISDGKIYSAHIKLPDWDFRVSDHVFDGFELELGDLLKDEPQSN